jgi:1,4-dihydroxy-2-naphthoate octaprenyltransferase
MVFAGCLGLPFAASIALAPAHPAALLALLALPLAVAACRRVLSGAAGLDLIPVLRDAGRLELAYAVLLAVGLTVS